jgi:hypothetical protein
MATQEANQRRAVNPIFVSFKTSERQHVSSAYPSFFKIIMFDLMTFIYVAVVRLGRTSSPYEGERKTLPNPTAN